MANSLTIGQVAATVSKKNQSSAAPISFYKIGQLNGARITFAMRLFRHSENLLDNLMSHLQQTHATPGCRFSTGHMLNGNFAGKWTKIK